MSTVSVPCQKPLVSGGPRDDGVLLACQGLVLVFVEKRE